MVPETPRKPADPATDGHPDPAPGSPSPPPVTSADHHRQRPVSPQNADTPNLRRLIRYRPNITHVRKMHPLTRHIESRDDSAACPKCGADDVVRTFGSFFATGRRSRRHGGPSEAPLSVERPTGPAGLI